MPTHLNIPPAIAMLVLDSLMIVYTLWALSTLRHADRVATARTRWLAGAGMVLWLALLHVGLSSKSLFPETISGIAFLTIIFVAVGAVGALLFGVPGLRTLLLSLDQRQLLLLQGIRVFFGAGFLMQAATGDLPAVFGIVDGFTHIGAGFFGLIAAYSVSTGIDGARRAWFANVFGLADILIVASSLALLLLPAIGPHHSMMYAVFLPAPLWLWFHVMSIAKLLGYTAEAPQPSYKPAHAR